MSETSSSNSSCQANQDCLYSIVNQTCINNRCIFACVNDNDCLSNGKCSSNTCNWSGASVPPLLHVNGTQKNLDATNSTNSTNSTTTNSTNPGIIAVIVVVTIVVFIFIMCTVFFICHRRRKSKISRDIKPQQSNTSRTSLRKTKRDSKERDRGTKKYQHDQHDDIIGLDEEKDLEENFEDSYSPAAVGMPPSTHRLPQRSQTIYGTSTPSTVEDYLVPQHHFMEEQQPRPFIMEEEPQYVEEEPQNEDQQQQQQQQQQQ